MTAIGSAEWQRWQNSAILRCQLLSLIGIPSIKHLRVRGNGSTALGFGRIVVSYREVPILSADLV